jgi:alanine dehydrogenase
MLKIGIIKENKQPADKRTGLTPSNCKLLLESYPNQIELFVESSTDRIFTDDEYEQVGCQITTDISIADVLVGVKEVPTSYLIPNKTYFFFSHTIKEQPYNQKMFRDIIAKKIKLIDYERLATKEGRILGFGKHAGIVGAYNGLLTYGKKHGFFTLKPAHEMRVYQDLVNELQKVRIPEIRIMLTGSGRVAQGAIQLLTDAGVKQIDPKGFLESDIIINPIFVNLEPDDLFVRKDGAAFDTKHFYSNHEAYDLPFEAYYKRADLMINGIYWSDDLPIYFTKDEIASDEFNISVIADITCDVEGSVPITYKATPIEDPVIGWDKKAQKPCPPFLKDTVDVMSVTNLPCELPADASELFGNDFATKVVPELLKPQSTILDNATITENGVLTEKYQYLHDYAFGSLLEE